MARTYAAIVRVEGDYMQTRTGIVSTYSIKETSYALMAHTIWARVDPLPQWIMARMAVLRLIPGTAHALDGVGSFVLRDTCTEFIFSGITHKQIYELSDARIKALNTHDPLRYA